jgi:CheY-like chemotaxis protein
VNSNQTILVVEDDPSDQFFIVEAFRLNGMENPVQLVDNGQEAIAYLKGEGRYADRARFGFPMFIITDLKMPRGDGFLLLQYLKQNPGLGGMPPAVLTASRDTDDIQKAYLLGAGCYVQKPASFSQLQQELKTLYNHWMQCEVPSLEVSGHRALTRSAGKLGERFGEGRA